MNLPQPSESLAIFSHDKTKIARALVVFSDDISLWWLRPLKSGFRHCSIAINHGEDWLMVEPMSNGTSVQSLGVGVDFDLKVWFESHGLRVVSTVIRQDHLYPVIAFYSCVEEVKRILRLKAPWVITPYQLYRHLIKEK